MLFSTCPVSLHIGLAETAGSAALDRTDLVRISHCDCPNTSAAERSDTMWRIRGRLTDRTPLRPVGRKRCGLTYFKKVFTLLRKCGLANGEEQLDLEGFDNGWVGGLGVSEDARI